MENETKEEKKEESAISKMTQILQNAIKKISSKNHSDKGIKSKVCYERKKKEIPSNKICILCDSNNAQIQHYTRHLKNPILPTNEWSQKQIGCLQIFTSYDIFMEKFEIQINNVDPCDLKLGKIILLSNKIIMKEIGNEYKDKIFNNDLDSSITFEIDLSMVSNVKRNRLLIFYEDKNGVCEYFESFDFYVCKLWYEFEWKLKERPIELDGFLSFDILDVYPTSPLMRQVFINKFRPDSNETDEQKHFRTKLTTFKPEELNPSNYIEMFTSFVEIEDYEENTWEFSTFITKQEKNYSFEITTKQVKASADLLSFLEEGKFITIQSPIINEQGKQIKYHGIIRFTEALQNVDLPLNVGIRILDQNRFKSEYDNKIFYNIIIYANRMMTQLQHLALENIKKFNIPKCLFPTEPGVIAHREIELKLFNKNIESNAEQKQAIQHIVMGTSYPAPYIIFGPPGTGKTSVIVESVCQLLKIKPKSKIIICVGANTVCNDIANALLKYIFEINGRPKLLRLYAPSAKRTVVNEDVLDISNYNQDYPSLECIYRFDIIVSTLAVSGRLVQASIDSGHFTHIFIDESGCVLETMALLPIAACSTLNKINAEIVLSGDPNQLGPITKCQINPLKLNGSFLERLMNLEMYQKNKSTNQYNPNVLTKLIKNYRSHGSIIKIPNELLYESEMIASGNEDKTKWALNLDLLPAPGFPIIFKDFRGFAEKEKNGTSWFNESQIGIVMEYIKLLFSIKTNRQIHQSDIGICTPYRAQCIKLQDRCTRRNWNEIEIGVAEQFQGQEKPIMIISMVRARTKKNKRLGFLNDIKRWNVIVTRAEALLIVIGDSSLLELCSYWKTFIDYVKVNNGFINKKRKISASQNEKRKNNENKKETIENKAEEWDTNNNINIKSDENKTDEKIANTNKESIMLK